MTTPTPLVLVHGGGCDRRCWDLLIPELDGPVLAVDLPGRGGRPMPLEDVDLESSAASVVADVDAAGFDEIVLVGHSLAGCAMPGMVTRLGERVRHAVYVACTVPEPGLSSFDTLDPGIQDRVRARSESTEERTMDGDMARFVLGEDLTDAQFAWCVERLVPEAPKPTFEPVDSTPLRAVPSTWVRTLKDAIVAPDKQLRFAGNVGPGEVIDLDAGHMCMVGQPAALAAILRRVAAEARGATPGV